jgi:hypothetical protein
LKYKEEQTGEQCFVLKTLLALVASVDPSISHKPIDDEYELSLAKLRNIDSHIWKDAKSIYSRPPFAIWRASVGI